MGRCALSAWAPALVACVAGLEAAICSCCSSGLSVTSGSVCSVDRCAACSFARLARRCWCARCWWCRERYSVGLLVALPCSAWRQGPTAADSWQSCSSRGAHRAVSMLLPGGGDEGCSLSSLLGSRVRDDRLRSDGPPDGGLAKRCSGSVRHCGRMGRYAHLAPRCPEGQLSLAADE